MEGYTKLLLTIIALGIVGLNVKLRGSSIIRTAKAELDPGDTINWYVTNPEEIGQADYLYAE